MVWTLEQYKAALKASQDEANRLNLLATSTKQESSAAKDAADKAAAKAAETKSIVDTAGYNLKWTQKTAAENAAKANTLAQQQAAQAAAKAKETEAAKRAAEFETVKSQYALTQAQNPFVYQKGSAGRGYDNSQYNNYLRRAAQEKTEAISKLRLQNFNEDGFQFASAGALQRDAAQLLGDISRGKGIGYRNISARGKKQVKLVIARRDLLSGKINVNEYNKRVGRAKSVYNAQEQRAAQQRSAQARAQVAGYLKEDSEKWNEVVSNSETYQNQLTGAKIMDVKQAPVINQGLMNR